MVEMGGFTNASLSQASDIQISETGRTPALQSNCPSRSEVLPTSCCQSFVSPSLLSVEDGKRMIGGEPCQLNGQPFSNQEQEFTMNAHDGFIYTSDDHTDKTVLQGQSYLEKDSQKLVPVNTFGLESNVLETCPSVDDKPTLPADQDVGGLCYEPPRFPSLDIPFFNCDLVPSGSDMQQEYSPLGIRQLMMSTTNCISPFQLWDSPSRDNRPDSLLKSAAKFFTGTPSILKKHHRDLLSPLSERRSEKKLETDMTFNLTNDLSCLDVMFNESGTGNTSQVHRPAAVLVERNLNDPLLFSPDHVGPKADRSLLSSSKRTPRNWYHKNLGAISNQGLKSECLSGNACIVVSSPTLKIKKSDGHSVADTTVRCVDSSAYLENLVVNTGNNAATESYNIFGDTPFKRCIEWPLAWKYPWFINSFAPGPRIDIEITIEDIGYLMSPVGRSYDAVGLMKQLSEHTAAAYADALDVLGNETPESIIKGRGISNPNNMDKENNQSNSHLTSNILAERRVLDFSECGTPGKGIENGKSSTAMSPSSSILKGLRQCYL